MRKPFVLAWAISPEQVVQFVKGQTTGWSIQRKKHRATFKHIPWNAALQQLIRSTSQSNFRPKGWCGARGGAQHSSFPRSSACFTIHCPACFLSSVSPCPPLTRGGSNSVSLSCLFMHLGTALLQPLLKPLISVSSLLCGMIFIKGVIRSQVGIYGMNYLLMDSIRNGQQMRTTH